MDEMAFERFARKIDVCSEIYIKKEQIDWCKNDQATRKSPGHITWVRALGLFMYKEVTPKLNKIEYATIFFSKGF
jgi:hypothetical protein